MAIDISNLLGKKDNEPGQEGKLSASEWNTLIQAVQENQEAVKGSVKGINYNGTEYKDVKNGILYMTVLGDLGRTVKFDWIQQPPETVSKGGECVVEFNVIDQQKDDNDVSQLVPYDQPGKVNFYVDEKLVGTVSGVYDPEYSKYTGPVKFDFSKVTTLSTKTDGNNLKIEYVNSGAVISKYFTVYVLDLSISVENMESVYTTDSKPNIKVTVRGANANLYVSVDDEKPYVVDGEEVRNGIPYYINSQLDKHNIHGIHTLKIWAEPIGYENVSTDVLTYNYIFGNTSDKTPIVMSTVTDGSSFELYGKMFIEYIAYLSGENGSKNVSIYVADNKNYKYLSTEQSVSFINGIGSNSFTFSLFPNGTDELVGDRKLVIGMVDTDGSEHNHVTNIVITPSSVNLEQAEGYTVYLSSNGRSNSESAETKRIWRSVGDDDKANPTVVDVTFDDDIEFLDTGSGWCYDGIKNDPNDPNDKGTVAMHLMKGKHFTLNYTPFKWNPTWKNDANGTGDGLTISIEFATRNCLNDKTPVISCMDYTQEETGRGFEVTASSMKLVANDISLSSKFKEDTRIKLDIVIEGTQTPYFYNTVVGTDPSAPDYVQKNDVAEYEALALVFVDGVYNGITLIGKNTSFQQGSSSVEPQKIRFGSDECDLDIYNIRIYNRALTMSEIVKNYSYDTPVFSEKIAIAQRNDIFSTANNNMPKIDVGKLRAARPELPFFYVELDPTHTDIMPQDKSSWKRLSMTRWQNPKAASGDANEVLTSWEAVTGVLRNQGTSSMTYPWPWRNWDWKTGDSDFTAKNDMKYYFPTYENYKEHGSKWHQMPYTGDGKALPLKKLTFKKDYASSEMCNNAICSDIFTDMALGIATTFKNAVSPAMRADLEDPTKKKTDLRLALKAVPCFMFQHLPDPNAEGSCGTGLDGMGMMNLIPNKNEVGYLGFKKNKWENADEGSTEREQSWELGDNLDDVFWVKKLDTINWNASDETFKNNIKDIYEARTPKDSCVDWDGGEADFGMTPKGKTTISRDQWLATIDEQQDIVDFHNWLVDTNQFLATDKPLTGSRELWNDDGTGAPKHTHDTKAYRKDKFANEAKDRLLLDQFILYYIWREQFWMFDSGLKNLQVYTVGTNPENPSSVLQWGCMVRDADTALGIENTGKDYFPPHIEDIDYYTESNGKITFHYGKAANVYDITELQQKFGSNAKAVLNGQFGSLWVNIRECFGSEIGRMYRALCSNVNATNFGASAAINKFRGHQEHWCENLYNFGMRQYFGGSPFSYFNKSALGDKKNSRAQWLERGFYYRRGKYQNLSDSSSFRINTYKSPDTVEPELQVKSYIPMYIGCGGTTAEMINSKNVIRLVDDTYEDGSYGKPISIGEDGFNFPNAGDAVSYIYGTDMITDIGDLARVCKLLRVQSISFPKLRELNLGHEKTRTSVCGKPCAPGTIYREYATKYIKDPATGEMIVDPDSPLGEPREFVNEILPNLDCSKLGQLTVLDVTNHTNLSELTINKCTQLQELYARGTVLKSINLPATTSLRKIYLGSELTSLELVDLTGIEEFVVEGLNKCGKLTINNCGSYMARESHKIVQQAINKLMDSYDAFTNPNVCTLRGIDWTAVEGNGVSEDLMEQLLKINANITGKINLKSLSNDLKVRLVAAYGNIDDSNNSLYITYPQEEIESAKLPSKMYLYKPEKTQLKFTVNPDFANTYSSAEWSITSNPYAEFVTDEDKANGIITRYEGEADKNTSATLTVTIKQLPRTNGRPREDIVLTSTVYFYERLARPGDYVFQDGTYSDELDDAKIPIGVCFYVDPDNANNRLMMALSNVTINSEQMLWGLGNGGPSGDSFWGSPQGIELKSDKTYNCYNISKLDDMNIVGPVETGDASTIYFTDDYYRDINNADNDYFMYYPITTMYGKIGWDNAPKYVYVDDVIMENGEYGYLEIEKDEYVPIGYYNTLSIIEHRNKVLDSYKDNSTGAFDRPADSGKRGELEVLDNLMTLADATSIGDRDPGKGATGGSHLYYPAASACFAYQPGAAGLIDKFKKHNWFLPSSGELIRMCYYAYQSYKDGVAQEKPVNSRFAGQTYNAPANAFYQAIKDGKLIMTGLYSGVAGSSFPMVSSDESNSTNSYVQVSSGNGSITRSGKTTTGRVRPICRF